MFWPYSLHWFRRRGHKPAGISLACGYGKRSASTPTKPKTGTNAATRLRVVECSSSSVPGGQPAAWVIQPMQPAGSSFTAHISSGPGTAGRGANGQRPEPAA